MCVYPHSIEQGLCAEYLLFGNGCQHGECRVEFIVEQDLDICRKLGHCPLKIRGTWSGQWEEGCGSFLSIHNEIHGRRVFAGKGFIRAANIFLCQHFAVAGKFRHVCRPLGVFLQFPSSIRRRQDR